MALSVRETGELRRTDHAAEALIPSVPTSVESRYCKLNVILRSDYLDDGDRSLALLKEEMAIVSESTIEIRRVLDNLLEEIKTLRGNKLQLTEQLSRSALT
jgi:hypothetical protein